MALKRVVEYGSIIRVKNDSVRVILYVHYYYHAVMREDSHLGWEDVVGSSVGRVI